MTFSSGQDTLEESFDWSQLPPFLLQELLLLQLYLLLQVKQRAQESQKSFLQQVLELFEELQRLMQGEIFHLELTRL